MGHNEYQATFLHRCTLNVIRKIIYHVNLTARQISKIRRY